MPNNMRDIRVPVKKNNNTDEFSVAERPLILRGIAEQRIADFLIGELIQGDAISRKRVARAAVNIVLGIIAKPDKFMADAGAKELALAMHPKPPVGVQRSLAAVVYCAMLHEVRR